MKPLPDTDALNFECLVTPPLSKLNPVPYTLNPEP